MVGYLETGLEQATKTGNMTGWEPEEFFVTHTSLIFVGALSITPPSLTNIASNSGQWLGSTDRQGLLKQIVSLL